MKQAIKRFLRKRGWFYYLRYSMLFELYERLFKPEARQQHQKEVNFYRSFLSPAQLIFDIGANDGHKSAAFLELSDKVVAVEPDRENCRLLQTRFRNNGDVQIENVAVAEVSGTSTLHVHHEASAFNTLSPKWKELLENQGLERWNETIKFTGTQEIRTRTLDELITQYGKPDFIKIDVEGFEPWVLRGLSQQVSSLSFESLLPEYMDECMDCLQIIHNLDPKAQFNVAKEEKLLLESFVDIQRIKAWVRENNMANTIEVIVRMNGGKSK